MFRQLVLATALLTFSTGCMLRSTVKSAELPQGGKEIRDVAYYDGPDFNDEKHRLNIFIPPGTGPHPVIVFVHGGGWFFGDRAERTEPYTKLGRRFASRGILTVVISYRLSPEFKHPAHIQDVSRAIAWTFAHAKEYGGDPSRIHLMGHSAGAQLVALAACDPEWLAPYGIRPDMIAGVISISGPYDVGHLGRSLFTKLALIYPAFGTRPETWKAASPETYLRSSNPPPFLVAWADGDPEILRHDGAKFLRALQERGASVENQVAPFKGHFSVIMDLGEPGDALGDEVEKYVRSAKPAPAHVMPLPTVQQFSAYGF